MQISKTNDISRYKRQYILPEIGAEGQKLLSKARILSIGAGGLGSSSLPFLVGAGIGYITIIDPDIVSLHNLHRQITYTEDDIGKNKVDIAKNRFSRLNSNVKITTKPIELTAENAIELFNDHDIIIDGSDNFSTRFLANDAAVKCGKPLVAAAIQGFEGQISTYYAEKGACYRCLYPTPPKAQIDNCAESGVLGPAVGILGAAQAAEVIKLIIDSPALPTLIGRLWLFDMRYNETRTLKIKKSANCPICSINPQDIKLEYMKKNCNIIPLIEAENLQNIDNLHIIDVREIYEWDYGHIENAEHLPLSALMQNESLLPKKADKNYVLYCKMGGRSEMACALLKERGIETVYNLVGGYDAWLDYLETK